MPVIKKNIEQNMKMESTPLVYLEYNPELAPSKNRFRLKTLFKKQATSIRFSMGYVSRPYPNTYRITTCRHLITDKEGRLPSKDIILEGLEVFARYQCVNKKIRNLMLEDVDIKVHPDILTDLLFIEITRPSNYNFNLLNQSSVQCQKRFPGNQVYYFQNQSSEMYFKIFEGVITKEQFYVTRISPDGFFYYYTTQPQENYRVFDIIDTTKEFSIHGASGSPILSRKGEVVGMICAQNKDKGKGIYLPIEKIERLYNEITAYHK